MNRNNAKANDGDITKIIRKGEYGIGVSGNAGVENHFQGFGVHNETQPEMRSIQAVPQSTLGSQSNINNQPVPQSTNKKGPMYESKAHQFGGNFPLFFFSCF
jgi:hypothetical protein